MTNRQTDRQKHTSLSEISTRFCEPSLCSVMQGCVEDDVSDAQVSPEAS